MAQRPLRAGRPALVVLALLGAALVLPAWSSGAGAAPVVPCAAAATRTVLTASADLDPTCTYTAGFDITASDVTLDCQGATIDGTGKGGVGILVRTTIDVALARVTIRDCHVIGFLNNVRVTRDGFRTLPAGHEYDVPTTDITVEDSELEGSRGVGVYVDGYVTDVTIRRNHIHDAGSTAVYLETGSKQNHVLDNELVHNGYVENGPDGDRAVFAGLTFWFWGTGREGIAVDGSFENVIRGNRLADNSAGGIFLYTNCGEYKAANPDAWLERRYPAAHNLIEDNTFDRGRNGVWVGSRMGENTLPMECGSPAYVDTPVRRVVLDRADHNTIRGNAFHDVTYGIRVEDDHTTVDANTFTGAADRHAVVIGTPDRTKVLHRPVTGTVLTDNRSTIAGNAWPYRWVDGQTDTTDTGNLALGRPTHLCEGEDLPRQTFIFAIAVAVAQPGEPKPSAPDLAIPEVGILPACASTEPTTTTTTSAPSTSTTATATAAVPAAPAADAVSGTADYTG